MGIKLNYINGYSITELMEQDRHLFVVGDQAQRKQISQLMLEKYPIVIGGKSPMAVEINDYGLKDSCSNNERLPLITSEFLNFSIASEILLRAKKNINQKELDSRVRFITSDFLSDINEQERPQEWDGLISLLLKSKNFYRDYYQALDRGDKPLSIDELTLPFMELEMFANKVKEALELTSYFGIIIDKETDISDFSTRAINTIVGSRANGTLSMKIMTGEDWPHYYDANGQLIQEPHDYSTYQLTK